MPLTDRSDSLDTRNLTVHDLLELAADTPIEFKEMAAPATPATGSVVVYAKTDGKLYAKDDVGTESNLTAGGAGEANTASNVGTGGVGVIESKVGDDLQFRSVNAGSAKIAVSLDAANKEVDIDLGVVASTDLSDSGSLYRSSGTDVAIADGGTGSSSASGARTNLGLGIGTDVQAHDTDLDAIAAVNTNGLVARTGAGTAASRTVLAGTGISVTNGDGSAGDPSINLATKSRTVTKIVYIEFPTASDSLPVAFLADDVTFVQVRGVTDTGTVDFNIERRATNTPDATGTDILSADLQATSAGASTSSFATSGAVAGEQWLHYSSSAVSGTPTKLWVALEFTID